MLDQKLLSELADKFMNNLPKPMDVNLFKEDVTNTLKLVLEQSFSDLDLVTKEEFDIQSKVLAKTRAQLDQLSTKISLLEEKYNK